MAVVSSKPRIVKQSVTDEIERLETYVCRMEKRYERPSRQIREDVAKGRIKETAEVTRWLASYNALTSLKGEPVRGGGTGFHTKYTKASIRAAWSRLLAKGSSTAKR